MPETSNTSPATEIKVPAPSALRRIWTHLASALRRIWTHLENYRELYLFPVVAIAILFGAIQLVHLLTGRAIIDDPGVIIGGLYNAMIVVVAITILGALQGHQIPDVDEGLILKGLDKNAPWQFNLSLAIVHLTNVLCTIIVFYFILRALFTGFASLPS